MALPDELKIFEKLIDEKYGIMMYSNVQREMFADVNQDKYQQLLERMGF